MTILRHLGNRRTVAEQNRERLDLFAQLRVRRFRQFGADGIPACGSRQPCSTLKCFVDAAQYIALDRRIIGGDQDLDECVQAARLGRRVRLAPAKHSGEQKSQRGQRIVSWNSISLLSLQESNHQRIDPFGGIDLNPVTGLGDTLHAEVRYESAPSHWSNANSGNDPSRPRRPGSACRGASSRRPGHRRRGGTPPDTS